MNRPSRFAVNRLHLPDGRIRTCQVLEIREDGRVVFFPLTEELPFTEWRGGDYWLSEADLKSGAGGL